MELERAIQAQEQGHYSEALQWLLQLQTPLNPATCLQLGLVFTHFAKWSEAESSFRSGLTFVSPGSELFLQLSSGLAELYHQQRRLTEALAICETALMDWETCPYDFELYKVLYFLEISKASIEKGRMQYQVVDQWIEKLPARTTPSQCVQQLILADKHLIERNNEAAIAHYERAISLGKDLLPGSSLLAGAHRRLAFLLHRKGMVVQAENEYLQAHTIFSVHYPNFLSYTTSLWNLGLLYKENRRADKAEIVWCQACRSLCSREEGDRKRVVSSLRSIIN